MAMAVQSDSSGKDDVKTQFVTREGIYRLMTLSEYSRPNRVGYTTSQGTSNVRVSIVTLPPSTPSSDNAISDDRICFNYGKELYIYVYKGVKKAADLTKPVDKKMYKGTNPTCHDFNIASMTSESVSLIIGFSTGQIQLIDPIKKELSKLFNEERLIDKSKVTCVRWVPTSSNLFMTAHSSGQMYVYNSELICAPTPPTYQLFKQSDGFTIYTCRTKSTRNPLYKWVIGADGCCINEFAFSPCGTFLAVASQDGFLRIFHYDTMEMIGKARSYFGGFLCVCWSPDSKYVVVGGEDDLITVWAMADKRVAARGQGHRSWVSVVAFDPHIKIFCEEDVQGEKDEANSTTESSSYYRLGSVSQDTQLCLWDLTEDVLKPPARTRASAHISPPHCLTSLSPNGIPGAKLSTKVLKINKIGHKHNDGNSSSQNLLNCSDTTVKNARQTSKVNNLTTLNIMVSKASPPGQSESSSSLGVNSLTQRLAGFSFGERRDHRRNFSLTSKNFPTADGKSNSISNSVSLRSKSTHVSNAPPSTVIEECCDPLRLIGTTSCPRFDECPVLEPLVCKKIAHERLTSLIFREDCIVTACQDGCVYTWARPGLPNSASRLAPYISPTDTAQLFERDKQFEQIHLVD